MLNMKKISVQDWLDINNMTTKDFPAESPRAGKYVGMATQKQKECLNRNRICHGGLTCYQAYLVIKTVIERDKAGMAKPEQLLALLNKGHYPAKLRRTTAKTAINLLAKW